jgi:hypothetical protein
MQPSMSRRHGVMSGLGNVGDGISPKEFSADGAVGFSAGDIPYGRRPGTNHPPPVELPAGGGLERASKRPSGCSRRAEDSPIDACAQPGRRVIRPDRDPTLFRTASADPHRRYWSTSLSSTCRRDYHLFGCVSQQWPQV